MTDSSDGSEASRNSGVCLAICAGLVLVTVLAFFGVWKNEFVDYDDNTYVFDYSNSFNISDAGSPGVFSGIMNDHFSLAGNGPADLHNGFQAVITTDFSSFFTFDPLKSFGDPFDFAAGLNRCDPL